LVSGKPPRRSVTLPPPPPPQRRYLNTFRGEPAISGFAWHFTPTHRSSRRFAIHPGSGLHARVPPASPCPWVAHPVSGRLDATPAPFRTRVRSGSGCPRLNLSRRPATRRLILQKARRHQPSRTGSDRPEAHGFRCSFTPLVGVLFTVPSRYWFPIGRRRSLALGGGPPRFRPDPACRAVLTQTPHPGPTGVAYGALTHSGRPFQQRSAAHDPQARKLPPPPGAPFNPTTTAPAGSSRRCGLGSPPFARRY
jgi:hypothetical protein